MIPFRLYDRECWCTCRENQSQDLTRCASTRPPLCPSVWLAPGRNDLLTRQENLMSSVKTIAQFRQLREQALWKLLASHNAPVVLAVFQELLLGEQRVVPASALHERLTQELQGLKQAGEDMTQSAQAYIAAWLSEGWLTRRLPAGVQEEQYELTTDAVTAIRFLQGVNRHLVWTPVGVASY